jgi:hypothetical protein
MEKINSFIILGKTGDGKSSLARFLSETKDPKKFKIFDGRKSGTSEIDEETFSFENEKYSVIDTPGFFDSNEDKIKDNDDKIIDAIKNYKNPISTVLVVVNFQVSRIDEPAQICIQKIANFFPMEDFWKHIVIIFTKYYPDPDDPESFETQKKNWEKDLNIFKNRIKEKNINNNNKIKVFYINNSKKSIELRKNLNIRKEILNYIKNCEVFYKRKETIKIEKERINLSFKNNEPDEKYENTEIRKYRSYSQIRYFLQNKMIIGPQIEIKRWTERIEFFEKFQGKNTKLKMKHLYIDNEFKGDFIESYEYLDINKIDHWEISCKCGFKDTTKYASSKKINETSGTIGGALGGGLGGYIFGLCSGPVGWGVLLAGAAGAGIIGGISGGFGGRKISEKITESQNIGLDTFEKGCPNCGKIELDIIPIFKD